MLLLLTSVALQSQDLIILREGKRYHGNVLREDSTYYYLLLNYRNQEISTFIEKDQVKTIRYDNVLNRQTARDSIRTHQVYSKCVSVGFLQGGGSIAGFDVEIFTGNILGIQAGAGYVGYGAGLTFHLKPDVRSSLISLQYWHQGIAESFTQSLIGPTFVFRAKKVFTAQLGFGFLLKEGPAWPESIHHPPVMLTYSVGFFWPG